MAPPEAKWLGVQRSLLCSCPLDAPLVSNDARPASAIPGRLPARPGCGQRPSAGAASQTAGRTVSTASRAPISPRRRLLRHEGARVRQGRYGRLLLVQGERVSVTERDACFRIGAGASDGRNATFAGYSSRAAGDRESEARETERGAAGQSIHALPMHTAEDVRRADADAPCRSVGASLSPRGVMCCPRRAAVTRVRERRQRGHPAVNGPPSSGRVKCVPDARAALAVEW
jgi:hypothetical protein